MSMSIDDMIYSISQMILKEIEMSMIKESKKPNILFIMTDQHRFDYLGCMGAGFVRTPHLDALADKGMVFENCFTNAPLCTPARISLASGLHPGRLGALTNSSYLPLRTPTYYQRLRDFDFRVGCVGKLDLAKPDPYNGRNGDRPRTYGLGFTHPVECEGKFHAGRLKYPHGPYTYYLEQKGLLDAFCDDYIGRKKEGWVNAAHDSVLPTEDYEDAYIGSRAAQWIEDIPDDYPWHLFVSFVGPHDPFDPPTEYADRWRTADMPHAINGKQDGKPEYIKKKQKKFDVDHIRRQYCATIELLDDQVGRIMEALKAREMHDNTYIIFTSDHGEMLGDHGLYQKSVPYEASLHIPLIVVGPGIEAGSRSDALIELSDLNPTVCELVGVPSLENIDATSFISVLKKESDTHRTEAVSMLKQFRCIRTERYKYIENINDLTELYDLKEDPNEIHNVVKDMPEVCAMLKKRMEERLLEGGWFR